MKSRLLQPHDAPPIALIRGRDAGATTLALPGYRQARSYSCGFASALMVVRYFGCAISGRELFERLGTSRDGTRQNALVRALRGCGVSVNLRYDVDFARLVTEIDREKPIIGYLHDIEHWIVIYGYGRAPERVFVADPEICEPCEQPWQRCSLRLRRFGIVCSATRSRPHGSATRSRPHGSAGAPPRQLELDFWS